MVGHALNQVMTGSTSAHNISTRDLAKDIHEACGPFLGTIEIWLEDPDPHRQQAARKLLEPISTLHTITANPADW